MTDLIYTPNGNAREYGDRAVNLFAGCPHGCLYCYAPATLRQDPATHRAATYRGDPEELLRRLDREAARKAAAGQTGLIFLCFICDPYPAFDRESAVTRRAIEILHRHGFSVNVLTKGGYRALRDHDLFTPADRFGVTLTTTAPAVAFQWEPNAAPPIERIRSLQMFHSNGVPTWVSLEPVISPAQVYQIIDTCEPFVNEWKIGKLNYHEHAKTIDWPAFASELKERLDIRGIRYTLKADLAQYLEARI